MIRHAVTLPPTTPRTEAHIPTPARAATHSGQDEPADPRRVGLLRPAAIVASPDDRADAVEQPRLLGSGRRSFANDQTSRWRDRVDDPRGRSPIHDGRSIDQRLGPAKASPGGYGGALVVPDGCARVGNTSVGWLRGTGPLSSRIACLRCRWVTCQNSSKATGPVCPVFLDRLGARLLDVGPIPPSRPASL